MTEKPKKESTQPAPRPPLQPDLALITYLERDRDPETVETRSSDRRRTKDEKDQ